MCFKLTQGAVADLNSRTDAATNVYAANVPMDIKSTSSFRSKKTAIMPEKYRSICSLYAMEIS